MGAYFTGAILALVLKFGRDAYLNAKSQLPFKPFLWDWLFCPTAENALSWATTIGCVWMLGSWVAGEFAFGESPQAAIPTHPSVLFTLGALSELIAPFLAEKLTKLAVGSFGEVRK